MFKAWPLAIRYSQTHASMRSTLQSPAPAPAIPAGPPGRLDMRNGSGSRFAQHYRKSQTATSQLPFALACVPVSWPAALMRMVQNAHKCAETEGREANKVAHYRSCAMRHCCEATSARTYAPLERVTFAPLYAFRNPDLGRWDLEHTGDVVPAPALTRRRDMTAGGGAGLCAWRAASLYRCTQPPRLGARNGRSRRRHGADRARQDPRRRQRGKKKAQKEKKKVHPPRECRRHDTGVHRKWRGMRWQGERGRNCHLRLLRARQRRTADRTTPGTTPACNIPLWWLGAVRARRRGQ